MIAAHSSGSRLLTGFALAGGLALLAACGSTPAGPGAPSGAGQSSAAGSPAPGGTVTVDMTEFKLALSQPTFTPGTYTFVAKNSGTTLHVLEIDGPGVSDQKSKGVQPGQSASLTVTLQNGSYEIYCPVDGHRSMGMDTKIMVGAGGGGSGPSSMPSPTGGGSGGGNGY